MKLILTTNDNQHFRQREICKVGNNVLSSMRAIRMLMCTHASRLGLGVEGRGYRIKQRPKELVPIYLCTKSGDTLTIE